MLVRDLIYVYTYKIFILKMKNKSVTSYVYTGLIISFFFIILLLYFRNITQDVYAGDIGDIATAAYFFGVPHPPGYPLLTILGFLFSKLPIPIPVISRIALVSVVAATSGLIVYFKLITELVISHSRPDRESIDHKSKSKNFNKISFDFEGLLVVILSTGILGFSYYYWLYAEVPEVFALNNFFVIVMYTAAYLFYRTKKINFLYLTSFIAGLSMTNQQAIMFVFPGLFVMVLPDVLKKVKEKTNMPSRGSRFNPETKQSQRLLINKSTKREDKKTKRLLLTATNLAAILKKVFIAFFLGLIPYFYIFISASTNPQINWMKEPTIYNFIRLLLRMDYKFGENLVDVTQRIVVQEIYFSTLITNFSLVLSIIGLVGVFYLFFREKRLFSSLLTGFLLSGPIFIFIITPEIIDPDELGIVERMFMHSFVIFSFFIPFGFLTLQKAIYKLLPGRTYRWVFLIPFFIVLFQMIYFNFPKTDLSKTKIGSNFAKDILGPLPKDSVVFLLGDLGTLNTWYIHYIEGFREDIKLAGSYGDRNDYENKIYNEFKKKNKNSQLKIETVIVRQLPEILKTRKVYSMFQFPLGRKDYSWIPRGLVFELMPVADIPGKTEYLKQVNEITKQYNIAYRDKLLLSEQNNIAPYISKQYANAFNHIGDFLYVRFNDLQNAYSYYSQAQIIDPQNPLSYAKLGIIQAELPAQCNLAVENIDTSIEMYKIYRPYYTFALRIYDKCKVKEEKINDLKSRYKKLFLKDLEKDPHY